MQLARLLRAGELTEVWDPDEAHEALRELIRPREAAVDDLRRKRHVGSRTFAGTLLRSPMRTVDRVPRATIRLSVESETQSHSATSRRASRAARKQACPRSWKGRAGRSFRLWSEK